MRVTVTVCDVCEDADRETRSWQVRDMGKGVTANVDLCEEHEKPLVALLDKAPASNTVKSKPRAAGGASGKARYRPHGIKVTTTEEIERKKRDQNA